MKKKILCWCDSPVAITGFGTVAKHVLKSLYDTDKYEIDVLGINHFEAFYDRELFPYQITPSRLEDPKDPYGTKMFLKSVANKDYDFIWILNDVPVANKAAKGLADILSKKYTFENRPVVIHYFPVDCRVIPGLSHILDVADIPVAYMDYGRNKALEVMPNLKDKLQQIPHGVDAESYYPVSEEKRKELRAKYFKVTDDRPIVINVNRNNPRKDLPQTLLVFRKFKNKYPDAYLYLHTLPRDPQTPFIDLLACCQELGLKVGEEVGFPKNYGVQGKGFPVEMMNELYNCADIFLNTTLGEGYGLSVPEAMAAGVPCVVPNNTNMPEFPGLFLYPCRDKVLVDVSGYRPRGRTEDIFDKLDNVWKMKLKKHKRLDANIKTAMDWVKDNTWDKINVRWVKLFQEAEDMMTERNREESGNIIGSEV